MPDDALRYIGTAAFLAVLSFLVPGTLLLGIIVQRELVGWEKFVGLALVLVSAPVSFVLTAYFFVGVPLVAILATFAGLLSRFRVAVRIMHAAPLAIMALWLSLAGAWALDCPTCQSGDNQRGEVWAVGGLLLGSGLALLTLVLEFGRVAIGRAMWGDRVASRGGVDAWKSTDSP